MFKKIFKTFGVKFSSAILNLMIAIVVSQFLGSQGKGEQSLIITTIAFILIFSNIVGGASLVYLTPRLPIKKLLLLSYLWTILVSAISSSILLFFPLKSLEHTYAIQIAILVTINSFAAVNCSILLGKENIRANNIITFSQVFITVVALLVMFSFPSFQNIKGYLFALYASYIISFIISIFFLLPYRGHKTNSEVTFSAAIVMLFQYGFLNQLAHIAQFLSFRVSYYILEYFSGKGAVGIYSNAVSITESVWMISSSIALVQYSTIANSHDNKANQSLTVEFVRISLLVTFIVLIPVILLPASLYSFIFSKEFFDTNRIMWCLAPGILVFVNALIIGHYFSGSGKYHVNTLGSTVGLIITIILSYLLIPRFGYMGAAVTASISYLATSVFVTWFFCREAHLKFSSLLPLPKYFSSYWITLKDYLYHKNQNSRNE